MATKQFDPNDVADKAFRLMFGVDAGAEQGANETDSSTMTETSAFKDQRHISPPDFRNSGRKKGVEHVGQKFYITKEQFKALRRRAYLDDNLDLSGHVRAALELYLAEDLSIIRSGQN